MRYLTFTKETAGSQISRPVSRIARRSAAVVVAAALGISVAACSSKDSGDGATDKETVTTTVQESAQEAPAQQSPGSKLHKISVDGKAVDTKLLSLYVASWAKTMDARYLRTTRTARSPYPWSSPAPASSGVIARWL